MYVCYVKVYGWIPDAKSNIWANEIKCSKGNPHNLVWKEWYGKIKHCFILGKNGWGPCCPNLRFSPPLAFYAWHGVCMYVPLDACQEITTPGSTMSFERKLMARSLRPYRPVLWLGKAITHLFPTLTGWPAFISWKIPWVGYSLLQQHIWTYEQKPRPRNF